MRHKGNRQALIGCVVFRPQTVHSAENRIWFWSKATNLMHMSINHWVRGRRDLYSRRTSNVLCHLGRFSLRSNWPSCAASPTSFPAPVIAISLIPHTSRSATQLGPRTIRESLRLTLITTRSSRFFRNTTGSAFSFQRVLLTCGTRRWRARHCASQHWVSTTVAWPQRD